ncbi:hypothetical protein COT50_00175 [candidate division WWE3 bacterium CG08_land_8_20_14_0_20_41_10]|uniref:Fido domain-containing protein n=1 Tax=candidate division WWE3 bacterium CG08_land_8_20_14_0_20_41_10 TaxID=1975085 RepID=A0A2H0XCW4_UNCKA|nr:MAG: hypothetical protein COT50_00175 [candidate division WWE3 bacterium CG08_land_8_20_14_0_20_41_10]
MFNPKYEVTPKIIENIKRVAVITAELNNKKFPQIVLAELEKTAKASSSHSSTRIEGNPLPLLEVRRILKTSPQHLRDSEREVLNYNQALEKLNPLMIKNETLEIDQKLVLNVHKIVTKDLVADFNCGSFRKVSEVVNNPATRVIAYFAPQHQDVLNLIADLLAFVTKNEQILDPLILAGIFHKQFVVIHPFMDGNGRTTRLLTKVILARMGLDTFNLFSFENYYNKNVSKYFEKVGVLGDYYEIYEKLDFTQWLEYFTDGVVDELLRVKGELETVSTSPANTIKPYEKLLLDYVSKHGFITDAQYSRLTPRAKATRALDFKKLLEMSLIKRVGNGRATHYI